MKLICVCLLVLNNLFGFNILNSSYDNIPEETKEVVNKENRNGMLIALLGSLVILEIGLLYKKKKIKL